MPLTDLPHGTVRSQYLAHQYFIILDLLKRLWEEVETGCPDFVPHLKSQLMIEITKLAAFVAY